MRYVYRDDNFNTLISILMIVIGLILVLWPGHVMSTAVTVLGLALLVGGAISIFTWYRGRDLEGGAIRLAEGVAMAAAGLFTLAAPGFLISIIPIAVGLVVLFNGIVNLAQALELRRMGYGGVTSSLVMAILTLLCGLIVIIKPFSTMEMLVAAIGVVILYNGASNLWIEAHYRGLFR